MEEASRSYLSLRNGFELTGAWQKTWFDISRQQMLLFDGQSYWLWAPWVTIGWDKPVFYYKNKRISTPVVFARISLDSHLLALQISLTAITVVDISSDKMWSIEIKSTADNEIIPEGLIWSEHGGNSQDLVIVTLKGIELYKVSPSRGQCRLSRYLSVKSRCFWYEPNFRTLLVANYQQSSRLNLHKQTIDICGFVLNFDVSDGPKLELPPPDKIPPLSVGPGVKPENIYLTSLYGKLVCAVYSSTEATSQVLLYSVSKQSISLEKTLNANISGPVVLSTLDNLLCCHYFDFNVSIFYDIKEEKLTSSLACSVGRSSMQPQQSGVCDPFCPPSPLAYIHFSTEGPESEFNASAKQNPAKRKSAGNNSSMLSSIQCSVWDAVDKTTGSDDMSALLSDSVKIAASNSKHVTTDASSNSDPESPSMSLLSKPMFSEPRRPERSGSVCMKPIGDLTFFSGGSLAYDAKTNTMWQLKCDLDTVVSTLQPSWRCVEFLARRGQAPTAPKPISGPDLETSGEAKSVLLRKLKNMLENKMSIELLRLTLRSLVYLYGNECTQLQSGPSSGGGGLDQPERSQFYSRQSHTEPAAGPSRKNARSNRMKSVFGSFDHRSDNNSMNHDHAVDERRIRYSISNIDAPVEVPVSPHLLRYEICTALKIEQTLRDRSSSRESVDAKMSIIEPIGAPMSRRPELLVPVSARRSADGHLFVSQMEMLCHVWIPLLYKWGDDDLVYFTRALTIYIAELQSVSNAVVVEPALSLLLFKILAVKSRPIEAARLMQIQFFSDSVELAVEAFDLADALNEEKILGTSKDQKQSLRGNSNISNVLRQCALDMLWRMNEITTAVRRLLEFGFVIDAISLCTKSKGTWRRGLSPASIPGIDFYRASLVAIEKIFARADKVNNVELSISREERICAMLSVLFNFLAEWDNGLLLRSESSPLSRLAQSAVFPLNAFAKKDNIIFFKKLYGFIE